MNDIFLSVVAPVYNEEDVVSEFYRRLKEVMDSLNNSSEIIFVNDGSKDKTLDILRDIAKNDNRVKIISFSRNFGHQIAITAGIERAKGQAVVIIDADLQDPPEIILELIKKWQEGFDVVYAIRKLRLGEKIFKTITARLFYRLIRKITDVDIPVDVGDFRLISRKATDAFKKISESHRYVRGLISWIGFKQTGIYYARDKRYAGKTKSSLFKMVNFSLDGISSFSNLPLKLATWTGFISSALAFFYIIYSVYVKYVLNKAVQGWTSLVVIVLFLGGVQLITIGILGEYISRVYDETKRRPLYLIDEKINIE